MSGYSKVVMKEMKEDDSDDDSDDDSGTDNRGVDDSDAGASAVTRAVDSGTDNRGVDDRDTGASAVTRAVDSKTGSQTDEEVITVVIKTYFGLEDFANMGELPNTYAIKSNKYTTVPGSDDILDTLLQEMNNDEQLKQIVEEHNITDHLEAAKNNNIDEIVVFLDKLIDFIKKSKGNPEKVKKVEKAKRDCQEKMGEEILEMLKTAETLENKKTLETTITNLILKI